MALISKGFTPELAESRDNEKFIANLPLLIENVEVILDCRDYFFVSPGAFAFCSWPYIGGDGPIYLGYLLIGWCNGKLIEKCEDCSGELLIYSFGGTFSGGCKSGVCLRCDEIKSKNVEVLLN